MVYFRQSVTLKVLFLKSITKYTLGCFEYWLFVYFVISLFGFRGRIMMQIVYVPENFENCWRMQPFMILIKQHIKQVYKFIKTAHKTAF